MQMTGFPVARSLFRVFLDSAGFPALVRQGDAHHLQAEAAWKLISGQRANTFTTNFVIAETHALFLTRLSHAAAVTFLAGIRQSAATIVRVTSDDERRVETIIVKYTDKDFSFTDATSFAVMERLGISTALTYNRDFMQYGFTQISA